MKFKYPILLGVFLLIVSFSLPGLAAGKIIIKPMVAASWRLDSNFYKAEAIEREVYTYLFQPGIEFGYDTAKSLVLLNYTLDAHYYEDQDAVPPGQLPADEKDYVGHTANLRARTKPFDRLTLGLDESYYKTRDPSQSDRFSNLIEREKYYINRLTPLVLYEFGPQFSTGLRYRNTKTDYSAARREDSTEQRGMFDLIYNFTRLTSLDLEYQRWKRDYDMTTSDYSSDQVKLILRKQFKYLSFDVGAGYHDRDFDDPGLKDIDIFTYRFALIGQNPAAPVPKPRSHISFVAELNLNDQGLGERYFEAHRLTLSAGHIFLEKLPLEINATYQNSDYETLRGLTRAGNIELRDDDLYQFSASLGYMITDWLIFTITGGYEERESNLAGYDYENEYLMARVGFSYSLGKEKD